MWKQIVWSIELIYLAVCTKSDLRGGWISVPLSAVCIGIGVLWRFVRHGIMAVSVAEMVTCLMPGMAAGAVAWLSRGGFGMGDAWMIAVSAWLLDGIELLLLVWHAFAFAGVYGAVLIVSKKKGRKDSFAFAPCMLAAYMIGIVKGSFL